MTFPVITAMPSGGEGFEHYDLVNQLNEPTEDGRPDENARMNCVVASFASVVMELKPGVITDGDYIKDGAYGQGYTGGMSGEHVAPFLKSKWGIDVNIVHGTQAELMQTIKDSLAKHHPVVITMPSMWNSQPTKPGYNPANPNFGTHAGVAFYLEGDKLSVMNPWGGFVQTESVAWWQERLCYGKVYVCSLEGQTTVPAPKVYVGLGGGFADLAAKQNKTADLVIPETYLDDSHSFCLFADGTVYFYSASEGICDDTHAATVVRLLFSAWQAAKNQPAKVETPAALHGAIADTLNMLAPFVNAYNELKKVA